jgi:hypothetical protein
LEQVDKLINAAEHVGRGTYPLYAFYNYWLPYAGTPRTWACPRPVADFHAAGWTILSAYEVARHLTTWRPSKKASDLSHLMYPVSCLFCCDCRRDRERATPRSLAALVSARIEDRWEASAPPRIFERAPPYVDRMFRRARSEPEFEPAYPTREQQAEFPPGIRRVMLIKDGE